jgi:hypothetical protein
MILAGKQLSRPHQAEPLKQAAAGAQGAWPPSCMFSFVRIAVRGCVVAALRERLLCFIAIN